MPLPAGTPIKITTLRGNRGVWWGRIAERRTSFGQEPCANIFAGPAFKTFNTVHTVPLDRPWSLSREQYMEVPEWDPEFLVAQAAHALGVGHGGR